MNEKSEAQIKNEEEVRRIMEERGYSPAQSKKRVDKTFSKDTSANPFIAALIVIGLVIGGCFFFKNNLSETEHYGSYNNNASAQVDQDQIDFQTCLNSVDTSEIAIDDADFWNKNIARYEQIISCYDKYPSVSSSAEKSSLQAGLAEIQENSKKAEANDAEYRANMARIDAELAENLARIKEESEAWDRELAERTREREAQRAEMDAEYDRQQKEREQQTATAEHQRQQQEQAAKAKCDEYLVTYGEKSAAEIAESDPEVVRAKNNWTQAQKNVRSAQSCTGGNVVYNQSQRDLCNSHRDQELQTAESYHSTYINLLQRKTTYYRNLRISSCGY